MNPAILIVDDSLTVRMDLGDAFVAADFTPTLCASVAEAQQALARRSYAVVLLDVQLPDGDGIELLCEIKASSPKTPVILLSSEAEVAARVHGLRTGADEYVGKPYDPIYIVARARELVRGRAPRAPSRANTVLLIDDSATFREALRGALEGAGYVVTTAESGEAGLSAALDLRPAAVIVDGVLPGIDGPTVIRRLRADAALRRTPCILLTASGEQVDEPSALDAGADAFLKKDDDPSVILARLGAVLRSHAAPFEVVPASSLLAPKKILAVDDSPTYLHSLAAQLRQQGYEVVLARSGEEALELLAAQPVDCVLLDLMMPGLSGHETCRIMKSSPAWRDIPLIILSAQEERAAMIEGMNEGADDYITKSSDFEVLRARLQAQLRRRQFEDETRSIREQLLHREMEATEARAARALAETRAQLLSELQATNDALMRAKVELEEQNRRVEGANRLKSEFLANMSHELRTPLNAILGFGELLYDGHVSSDTPRHQEFLGYILTSGRHLLQLVNDVLDLAKIEAGKLELCPEAMNPLLVVGEVVAILRPSAAQKHIQLEAELDPALTEATLDAARLKQVVYNYLSNALKFTPEGGRVVVRLRDAGAQRMCIEIEDSGIGIDAKDLGRLFVEFEQLEAGAARRQSGTGLGLAFTKRIVEAQGGSVGVTSMLGSGSTFYALLPRFSVGVREV